MTDVPMTGRWVADSRAATTATRALIRQLLRQPRWWLFVASVETLTAAVLAASIDGRYGITARLVWGAVYALVPTLCASLLLLILSYVATRRRFGDSLRKGVVLEAGFGDDFVVLRGPRSEHRLSFVALTSVRSDSGWVFLQQRGTRVLSVWPVDVFGAVGLARLTRAVNDEQVAGSR